MAWDNKVVWSEGMFLRTHHFQQFDRYVEKLVRARLASLMPLAWGIGSSSQTINRELLTTGKFAITAAHGALEDGTPFDIPEDVDHPAPMTVQDSAKNTVIYLALPVRQPGHPDIDHATSGNDTARYDATDFEATDAIMLYSPAVAAIQVARLQACATCWRPTTAPAMSAWAWRGSSRSAPTGPSCWTTSTSRPA